MEEKPDKSLKPLVLQSGTEMMDTVLGERATDAVTASGRDWVKAVTEGRMPSRHNMERSR